MQPRTLENLGSKPKQTRKSFLRLKVPSSGLSQIHVIFIYELAEARDIFYPAKECLLLTWWKEQGVGGWDGAREPGFSWPGDSWAALSLLSGHRGSAHSYQTTVPAKTCQSGPPPFLPDPPCRLDPLDVLSRSLSLHGNWDQNQCHYHYRNRKEMGKQGS